MKGAQRFEVRGCPYKAIPDTVYAFCSDYFDIQNSLLAPYRPDELPAKFAGMKDTYTVWRAFFQKKVADRDKAEPDAMAEINAFRAKEAAR